MSRPLLVLCGALLVTGLASTSVHAQCYYPIPQAPDACGTGYYSTNICGQWYGPGYAFYPPFPPFNGMVPAPPQQYVQALAQGMPAAQAYGMYGPSAQAQARFPTHPFARGPRDFFMYDGK